MIFENSFIQETYIYWRLNLCKALYKTSEMHFQILRHSESPPVLLCYIQNTKRLGSYEHFKVKLPQFSSQVADAPSTEDIWRAAILWSLVWGAFGTGTLKTKFQPSRYMLDGRWMCQDGGAVMSPDRWSSLRYRHCYFWQHDHFGKASLSM